MKTATQKEGHIICDGCRKESPELDNLGFTTGSIYCDKCLGSAPVSTPWEIRNTGLKMSVHDANGHRVADINPTRWEGVTEPWSATEQRYAGLIVRSVNARLRHIEALAKIKALVEKQIVDNPLGKTIAPEIHALVMKALDSYDVQDALGVK